jgi:hypothetical protein
LSDALFASEPYIFHCLTWTCVEFVAFVWHVEQIDFHVAAAPTLPRIKPMISM